MTLQKFGRYEIVKELGQGGMAEVYEAHDPIMNRLVALKIIRKQFSQDPRFHDRFWREAQTIANLEHRAIVPVHDFGADEPSGQLYLVMRLMPDVLNKRLVREGSMSLENTSLILNRLAAALNAAHSRGIMHRDIKPANILLDDEGTVFLADFGLAAAIEKIESGMVPSAYGGSMFYMAPEQWQDEPLGQYTDVYQLGVTLFEMLTGQRPFPDPDPQILLEQHVNGWVPDAHELNPMLPRKIQPILEKAMANTPKDRYATVLELAEEFANLLRPKQIKRRYEIKEELQHGRFAIVYQAQDLINDQRVALKIMKQQLLPNQRFQQAFLQQQQQILNLPTHSAIMPVYDVDLHKGKPFVAMKFVEGASLRERFRNEHILPIDRICEIAQSLADALDALHENGQVHSDINMGNVLIEPNDNCILTDFHMTAVAELTQSVMEQEAPLAYAPAMAPEQWARELLVPQTDVYQVAILLFELLSGQRPFAAKPLSTLPDRVAQESPPLITSLAEHLPQQFNEIFVKALAKQPEDRYARASELVQALSTAWQNHSFETFEREGSENYVAKRWDEAIVAFRHALNIKPDNQAVAAALQRAERRKQEQGILNQSRQAIAKERWQDADYFLTQVSDTPEKKELQELVRRKLKVGQLYSEGKLAIQQKAWFQAQKLLDETDFLEPNYKDVNLLLGQMAEKIESCLQQAREAIVQAEYARALSLLEPVAEHETAVVLRQEIAEKRQPAPITPPPSQRSRRGSLGWGTIAVLGLVVAAFFLFNRGLTNEEKLDCLKTAVPELHINRQGEAEQVLQPGGTAKIIGEWETLDLFVEWGPDGFPAACQRFFNEDSSIESTWGLDLGEVQKTKRWEVTYLSSSLSPDNDRIVVTLLYDGQPLENVFLLHFQP